MKLAAALLLFAVAAPAVAQMAAPPPPPPGDGMHDGRERMHWRSPMFTGMSDAGKATLHAAMHDGDPQTDHAATRAARDRMLAVLDADRLDATALRRAMDDEREAANAAKARHQAAMVAAFQQLSLADRRAFVINARAMRNRIEDRMAGWRGHGGSGGPRGAGAMMPPPPQ